MGILELKSHFTELVVELAAGDESKRQVNPSGRTFEKYDPVIGNHEKSVLV